MPSDLGQQSNTAGDRLKLDLLAAKRSGVRLPLGPPPGYCAGAGIRARAVPRRMTDSAKNSAPIGNLTVPSAFLSLAGRGAAMARTRRSVGSVRKKSNGRWYAGDRPQR